MSEEVDNKHAFEMLVADFQGKYQTLIEAQRERVSATRINFSFLSGPFIVVTALLTTKVINVSDFSSAELFPSHYFLFLIFWSVLTLVPYVHFIEANARYLRIIRNINNFRSYYHTLLTTHFQGVSWTSDLPIDPNSPETYNYGNWGGIQVIFIAVTNTIFASIGAGFVSGIKFNWVAAIAVFLLCILVHHLAFRRKQ
ncbi:hypothetical protein COB64_04035 [Candidatus Wolfebacteria bacterium]|nr:MAG: hypothetical protein COB64_04035 [Candidatus Wolfebacteria bacterium]